MKPERKAVGALVRKKMGVTRGRTFPFTACLVLNLASLLFSYLHKDNMVTNGFFMGILLQRNIKYPKI